MNVLMKCDRIDDITLYNILQRAGLVLGGQGVHIIVEAFVLLCGGMQQGIDRAAHCGSSANC